MLKQLAWNQSLEVIPNPVLTKKNFQERYAQGEFGNCSPTWETTGEFVLSGYEGLIHLRNRTAGGPTLYNVQSCNVVPVLLDFCKDYNLHPENFYISAMCPTHLTLFQGEVMRSYRHLDLYYSTIAKPMRQALQEGGKQCYGIAATKLLEHYLCPNSYDWLMGLLDRYEGHVVEFTTLSCFWGTVPNFNTLFWEVRLY